MTLLTPQQVSELFKIPVVQVRKLARQGKLSGGKVGRLWRFKERDVWRYFEASYGKIDLEIYEKVREIVG